LFWNLRPFTNNTDDRPLDRVRERGRSGGSSDGVKGVASRTGTRSTTSSGRRHNAETAAARTARRVRDETRSLAAAIRQRRPSGNSAVALGSSRLDGDTRAVRPLVRHTPTNTRNSAATHTDGRTSARPAQKLQRPSLSVGHTLRQLQRRLLLWLLSFITTEQLSYTRAQFQYYTVSR